MKYFAVFVLTFVTCFTAPRLRASDSSTVRQVVIGNLHCGRNISFKESKLEAGLALALELSRSFQLVPSRSSDSVARHLHVRHTASDTGYSSVGKVATALNASGVVFVRVDRLENILRAEITLATGDSFHTTRKGQGYALIRLKSEKKNTAIADPAVLTALQRAWCEVNNDTSLYNHCEGVYKVKPAATVVAGGLVFTDDTSLPPWDLFKNHTVAGFDAVVNVFDALKDSPDYVCYDVDTRDSIFALFKLFLIENDKEPSREELDALFKLDVRYYITGTCRRTENGAEIKMYFCVINNNASYRTLRVAQETLDADDIQQFREKIRALATALTASP